MEREKKKSDLWLTSDAYNRSVKQQKKIFIFYIYVELVTELIKSVIQFKFLYKIVIEAKTKECN